MKETNNYHYKNLDDEIDLKEFFYILWKGKGVIFLLTTFVSIIAVIYSLLLPNIYESKAILIPVDSSNNISSSMKNFSSLAALAGTNISAGADTSNSRQALQRLESLSFFENNFLPKIFLPNLMAFKSWNHETNTNNYDETIYSKKSNTWVRDYSYPYKQIPSSQESYMVFINQHLDISEDTNTGFITLKIRHQSPFIAKKWVELMVNEVNTFYKDKDKLSSDRMISYLNKQIAMTNFSEVKVAIAQILQEETKKLALIEANDFYVYDYVDFPAVMEIKSEPSRALICILFALMGSMLSMIYVLIKYYFFTKEAA